MVRVCERGPWCPFFLQNRCRDRHPDEPHHRYTKALFAAWCTKDPHNKAPCYERFDCEWAAAK
jgi:hypothetical protein